MSSEIVTRIVRRVVLTAGLVVSCCAGARAAVVHVAKVGSDLGGDGSAERPYATIQKGADMAAAGDEIRIAGGVYDESVTLHTYRHVSGSWSNDFTSQDLRNGRTVIRSTATSKPALSIPAEDGTNAIDAVTLTGGSAGLQSRAKGGSNDNATYNMPLSRLIVTNNVVGLDFNGGFNGAKMVACLVANNSGKGYHHAADHGTISSAVNCTFSGNGQALCRTSGYMALIRVRNCVFVNNTTALYTTASYSQPSFDRTIFYANGVREEWSNGKIDNLTSTRYICGISFADPKLGADFAPGAGSAAIGRGIDATVARPLEDATKVPAGLPVVETDVYGTPFDGTDIGCVKATAAVPTRLNDVYVATTGDDANSGADAEHPKRSINNAVTLLADGGTCHLADGTYVESVALGVTNVTLVGASMAGTVIRSETGTDGKTKDFAVGIFAPEVVVSNLTCAASGVGVLLTPSVWHARNPKVVRTVLTGNCIGFAQPGTTRADCNIVLSHTQIRDSLWHGVYAFNVLRIDNTLIADSGACGIFSDTWNNAGVFYLNNVTVTGSGTYGYYFGNAYTPEVRCYNSIFQGNRTQGVYALKEKFGAYRSCFFGNGNGNANTGVTDEKVGGVASCLYEDPLIDATATLRGHLAAGSPCAQTGGNYSAIAQVPSTSDLDYMKRLEDKMDIGCFISPETMEDLAGDGYHVVSVEGEPNGYGTVVPAYGRQLLADGLQRLDVRGTLYTDGLDGVRAATVMDGTEVAEFVRAAYRGFAYVEDGAAAPKYASDTAEYVDVDLSANATMTWKWERQNRVIVSTGAAGCKVRINDGPAASCVTNWIKAGSSYTVTFIPTEDFEFDSWQGDFPETADGRFVTATLVSDRPRAVEPRCRPLLHVSAAHGDDGASGDGTRMRPFATIGRAIAASGHGGIIFVQGGTYNEAIVNTTLNELTITGGYDENWQRDLVNCRTIVNPGDATKVCLTLDNVISNTVKGLTLTGGRVGVAVGGPTGQDYTWKEKATRVHNLEQLVVTGNAGDGIRYVDNRRQCGLRLVSSHVYGNRDCGVRWNSIDIGSVYIHNCTIAGNGSYGAWFEGTGYVVDVRNTVLSGNGGAYEIFMNGSYQRVFTKRSVFFGGTAYPVRLGPNTGGYPRGGVLYVDPELNDDGTPAVGSVCAKAGENLFGYPLRTELEDLLGRPWNGEYDIGCFKTDVPSVRLADVYVSTTGDDAAAGTAEAPLRTIARGLLRVAENGTVHVSEGVYDESVSVDVPGVTLAGAGRNKTFVRGVGKSVDDCAGLYAVHAAADNVVIRDLGACGNLCGAGVLLGFSAIATNAVVRDCALDGNRNGAKFDTYQTDDRSIYAFPDEAVDSKRCYHHVSHCTLTNNTGTGFLIAGFGRGWIIGDNLLIARNGGDGINAHECSGSGVYTYDYFYSCTIADNAGCGVRMGGNGDSAEVDLVNSIVTGNAMGLHRSLYNKTNVKYSIVSGNGTDLDGYAADYKGEHAVLGDVPGDIVDRAPGTCRDYALSPKSVACGLARALTASDRIAEPTTDLAGTPRRDRDGKRDAGCFARRMVGMLLFLR